MKKLLIFFAFIMLYGCSKGDDGGESPSTPTPEQPQNPDKQFCNHDIPDVLVMSRAEAPYLIYIESNIPAKDFSIAVDNSGQSWCQATLREQQDGTNNYVLEVACQHYDDVDENPPYRSTQINIKAGNVLNKRFTLVQEGQIRLTTDVDYTTAGVLTLSPAGETATVKVLTNCYSWMTFTKSDWITVTKKDESTLTVTSTPRPESIKEPRTAEVTVMSNKVIEGLGPTMVTFKVTESAANIDSDTYLYENETTEWD